MNTKHSRVRSALTDRIFVIGALVFAIGSGPLFIWLAIDPKANPVGPGMMAMFTFWPSILMMLVGLIRGATRPVSA